MPRYFFDIVEDGEHRFHDVEGEDFDTLDEAKAEARQGALTVAQERSRETSAGTIEIEIRDENGVLLGHAVVTFTGS